MHISYRRQITVAKEPRACQEDVSRTGRNVLQLRKEHVQKHGIVQSIMGYDST